jgi:hypothetical protein
MSNKLNTVVFVTCNVWFRLCLSLRLTINMFVSSLLDYVVRHYQCQQANIDVGNVVITIHTGASAINLLPVNTGFYLIVVHYKYNKW